MNLTKTQKDEFQHRFDALEKLIQQRVGDETRHPEKLEYQTYPTTVFFKSFEGSNLLELGAKLGQVDSVMEMIKDSNEDLSSVLHTALLYENFDLAEKLIERGVNLFNGAYERSVYDSDEAQAIYDKLTRDKLKTIPETELKNSPSIDPKAEKTYFDLMAELGELDQLPTAQQGELATLVTAHNKTTKNRLLHRAVANGHKKEVEFLLSQNIPVDSKDESSNTTLHIAVEAEDEDIVAVLEKHGANLNARNLHGWTPLHTAIKKKNPTLVRYLLEHGADPTIQTARGSTVFHFVASDDHETIALLNQLPQKNSIEQQVNMYGLTAQASSENPNTVDINQGTVMRRMKYYMKLHYRSFEFYSEGGHCSGLSFLYQYYSSIGKLDEFFSIQELISKWDGSVEYLEKKPTAPLEDYKTNREIFESFLHDMIFFQTSENMSKVFPVQFKDRKKQLELVSDIAKITKFGSGIKQYMSREKLKEYLLIHSRLTGLHIEFGGGSHATSARVLPNGKFEYYDPNFQLRSKKQYSQDELANLIIETKYRWLDKEVVNSEGTSTYDVNIDSYFFDSELKEGLLPSFEYFTADELPQSMKEAANHERTSPNHFSDLDIALVTQSRSNMKHLMSLPGSYDFLSKKDLKTKPNGTTEMLLQYITTNQDSELLTYYMNMIPKVFHWKWNELSSEIYRKAPSLLALLASHPNSHDLTAVFLEAVKNEDSKAISIIRDHNKVNLKEMMWTAASYCNRNISDHKLVNFIFDLYLDEKCPQRTDFISAMFSYSESMEMTLNKVPNALLLVDKFGIKIFDQIGARLSITESSTKEARINTQRQAQFLIDHILPGANITSINNLLNCIQKLDFPDKPSLIKKVIGAATSTLDSTEKQKFSLKFLSQYAKQLEVEFVKDLLQCMDVNILNIQSQKNKNTLLHKVLKAPLKSEDDKPKREKLVELLLEHGADLDLENQEGKTCRALLESSQDQRLIDISHVHDTARQTKNK